LELVTLDARPTLAEYKLVRRMRASFCVLGPLVARRRRAVVSLPGGCDIGTRPVDLHLAGLAALGAELRIEHGYVIASAPKLRGAAIDLAGPYGSSVTGTANVLSAAVLAQGRTVITSAAVEPEIVDLAEFLIAMGARISGHGTPTIEIRGVEQLEGTSYRVISDRIEAATVLIAAAITSGQATVLGVNVGHLSAVLEALSDTGADVSLTPGGVSLRMSRRPRSISIDARPYPGVPTDLQAQLMALAAVAAGRSHVRDGVFPERFRHVDELVRLGARITRRGATATIDGVERLSGAEVTASDLRASAALVLAALSAQGRTIVRRANHLDRGYEGLEVKLARLGARLERLSPRHASGPDVAIYSQPGGRVSTVRIDGELIGQRSRGKLSKGPFVDRGPLTADEALSVVAFDLAKRPAVQHADRRGRRGALGLVAAEPRFATGNSAGKKSRRLVELVEVQVDKTGPLQFGHQQRGRGHTLHNRRGAR
jgi:UDP-N-acetylglucosamine 1-carboxyvinyltransferase